jgi:hypothetical protein
MQVKVHYSIHNRSLTDCNLSHTKPVYTLISNSLEPNLTLYSCLCLWIPSFLPYSVCVCVCRVLWQSHIEYILKMRQESVDGIATRYGLDSQGIESQWGARFSTPIQTGPEAHPASYTMGTGSLSLGCGADHPPHLVWRLKNEYSYTSTPLVPVIGSALPSPVYILTFQ